MQRIQTVWSLRLLMYFAPQAQTKISVLVRFSIHLPSVFWKVFFVGCMMLCCLCFIFILNANVRIEDSNDTNKIEVASLLFASFALWIRVIRVVLLSFYES